MFKMQFFYYDMSDEETLKDDIFWSEQVCFPIPIAVKLDTKEVIRLKETEDGKQRYAL
ncbi:MAG: hypothetical protein IJ062_11350 [Firmicutes bacterium]|nr:hypothetical protein [Bacillota bacterium]